MSRNQFGNGVDIIEPGVASAQLWADARADATPISVIQVYDYDASLPGLKSTKEDCTD